MEVIPLPAGIHNISRCDLKAVALPTAVFTAHNPGTLTLSLENRNVAVLADSGAQRTLISRAAADRLKLDIVGQERACLQGFGHKSGSNSLFDVVRIKLGRVHETQPVIFDAFIVPNLNPLHMSGAAKFAKKIAAKGLNLADWRLAASKSDVVSFDLLLGSDHYYKIVNPFRLPRQFHGMWLPYTVYGHHMLLGKIPGSASDKRSQTVNYVNIQHVSNRNVPESHSYLTKYAEPKLSLLEANDMVHKTNAFHVAHKLNGFEAPGLSVATCGNEDNVKLNTFKSNMYKDFDKNTNFIWVPRVATPPAQEKQDINFSLVNKRFLILGFLFFVICALQICFNPLSLHIWTDNTLNLDQKYPILIPEIKSYSRPPVIIGLHHTNFQFWFIMQISRSLNCFLRSCYMQGLFSWHVIKPPEREYLEFNVTVKNTFRPFDFEKFPSSDNLHIHPNSQFWIPKDTPAINSVVKICSNCNIERGQWYHLPDGPYLTFYRFGVQFPWTVIPLDMTGHLFIQEIIDSTLVSVSKRWISDILSFFATMVEAWRKIEAWHKIEKWSIFHAMLKNLAWLINGT